MEAVWIMLAMAIAATLAVHLGLTEAIAAVVMRIASCERCAAFWLTAAALWHAGADVITIAALSILAAYASHWVGIILIVLQHIYNKVWQRANE